MLNASEKLNRSMLYRWHQENQGVFIESNQAVVVSHYGKQDEKKQMQQLGLIDLSTFYRIGFKGKDTPNWLSQQNIALPNDANQSIHFSDNSMVARLSSNEFLFLANFANQCQHQENLDSWQLINNTLCYQLLRGHSHFHFVITGSDSIAMFSKLCGIDLRDSAFKIKQIAQTSIARISGIIIKDEINQVPVFHLLADSSTQAYVWSCLLDAMHEFDGKAIGVNCLSS